MAAVAPTTERHSARGQTAGGVVEAGEPQLLDAVECGLRRCAARTARVADSGLGGLATAGAGAVVHAMQLRRGRPACVHRRLHLSDRAAACTACAATHASGIGGGGRGVDDGGMVPWLLINLLGLAACIAVAAFAVRWPRRRLALAAAALALLVGKSVLAHLPEVEAALLPWTWYVYLQGYWIHLAALAFLGAAIPQLPLRWNRIAVAALAGVCLAWGGWETAWMLRQRPLGEEVAPGPDHHLTQTTGYTCAPCAAAIALGYAGVRATERGMARLCLTREEGGTTAFNTWRGLRLALEGGAWRPRLRRITVDELLVAGRVSVIDFPAIAHAITVVGRGADALLHDPLADEPRAISRDELAARYGGTAVVLEPDG